MKKRIMAVLALLAGAGFFAGLLQAQSPDAAAEHKKQRDNFIQAELAAQKRQVSGDSFQRELDKLVEQRNQLQQDIAQARGKGAYAAEKLKQSTATGHEAEIEKWRAQSETWSARVQAAETELARVDSDIQATVQALHTSLRLSDEGALLLPGESVEVFVAEDDTLNGVYQIRRGGYIILPRLGRVMLAGKNLTDAETAIREALGQTQIKNATVMVERPQGGATGDDMVIYFAGEFLKPGGWKVPRGTTPTLVTAILHSGGLAPTADLTKVRLLRLVSGQALVEEVNVQAILDGAGLRSDLTLNPGDIIMVPAYDNVVYVTGNVLKPGMIRLEPTDTFRRLPGQPRREGAVSPPPEDVLTAYSAILRAGGFSRFANRRKVYVLRDEGNGVRTKIPVDIKKLQSKGGNDVILQSRDIVVVPEKFFSF